MALHGKTVLHKDVDNLPVQGALCPIPGSSQAVAVSGITARTSTAFTYKMIRVLCSVPCYFRLGDSTVTAAVTDHYLPPNVIEYFTVKEYTHIAAITAGAAGTLIVSEMG